MRNEEQLKAVRQAALYAKSAQVWAARSRREPSRRASERDWLNALDCAEKSQEAAQRAGGFCPHALGSRESRVLRIATYRGKRGAVWGRRLYRTRGPSTLGVIIPS